MKKTLLAIILLLCATSCATQQFKTAQSSAKSAPQYESSQQFFVYGIGQTQEVNSSEICGGEQPAQVTNKLSPLDAFIGLAQRVLIFVEVYSPRTTSVTCK